MDSPDCNYLDSPDHYNYVEQVVRSRATVSHGMTTLITYCEENCPSTVWQEIRKLDFECELPRLRAWLEDVLTSEPPAAEIEAYWFGLFNLDEDGVEICELYVAGSNHLDPDPLSSDWAVNPSYFPEGRYAGSRVLADLHRSLASADSDPFGFGDYTLCLGYAGLAVAHLCAMLDPVLLLGPRESRMITVGFDDGDLILLGAMDRGGLHFASQDSL